MIDIQRLVAMVLGAGMLLYAAYKGVDGALIGGASLLIGYAIGRTQTEVFGSPPPSPPSP